MGEVSPIPGRCIAPLCQSPSIVAPHPPSALTPPTCVLWGSNMKYVASCVLAKQDSEADLGQVRDESGVLLPRFPLLSSASLPGYPPPPFLSPSSAFFGAGWHED
eukprot:1375102-Pyramimonas_sp.AAC.1